MSQSGTADSPSASLPLDMTTEDPVPSAPKAVYRFFEPIILFTALIEAVKHTAKPPTPEPNIDITDPKQLFCAVNNKLCHVCDYERGGRTVTSFVALPDKRDRSKARFVFAVNRQTDSQLQDTAIYVRALFRKINQAPQGEKNQHEARGALLYHILRFNRPRVSFYLRNLRSQAEMCLERCQSANPEDSLIAEELEKILVSPPLGSDPLRDREVDYMHKCETTIQLLIQLEKSTAGAAIKSRALEDRIPGFTSMECWSWLFHTMNRILAYPQSAKFFLRAKRVWPSLFENPDVGFLSSSRPMEKPARQKIQKADGIVGRMTSNPEDIELYRNFAESLQAFDLDARIHTEFKKKTFKPIAHAEVILLNWLLKPEEVAPEKFFNGWAYIGSSKRTCKLCDYYFQEHGSNVEHRISHGNFYPSWRIPDVFPHQGREAKQHRQLMINRVLDRVRKDTFDIVEEKASPIIKRADSNTFSARLTIGTEEKWHVRGSEADDVDDIASKMGGVSLSS